MGKKGPTKAVPQGRPFNSKSAFILTPTASPTGRNGAPRSEHYPPLQVILVVEAPVRGVHEVHPPSSQQALLKHGVHQAGLVLPSFQLPETRHAPNKIKNTDSGTSTGAAVEIRAFSFMNFGEASHVNTSRYDASKPRSTRALKKNERSSKYHVTDVIGASSTYSSVSMIGVTRLSFVMMCHMRNVVCL